MLTEKILKDVMWNNFVLPIALLMEQEEFMEYMPVGSKFKVIKRTRIVLQRGYGKCD